MKKRILLAAASGLFMVAAHPPVGLGLLAWVGLVPLLFSLEGAGKRAGFLIGLVCGSLFFVGDVYWVVNSMYYYGGVPIWISVPVMLGLAALLACYIAFFGLFVVSVSGASSMVRLIAIAAAWTSLEYLRGHLFTGFPWSLLAYTQMDWAAIIQIADITGVWGISFLVVMVNVALYLCVRFLLLKAKGRQGRWPVVESAVTVAALLAVFVYGTVRIRQVDIDSANWQKVRVAAVQGAIDQSKKWDTAFRARTVDIYRELTRLAAAGGAQLVVWPETAVPFFLGQDKAQTGPVLDAASSTKVYLLTGSPAYTYNLEARQVDLYNSAWLINPAGELAGRYDKTHLVPFGEYVPLRAFMPFIKKLTAGIGDFSEGPGPLPIRSELGDMGVLICYEAIFPEIASGHVRGGAGILVNITNDAWFGRSSAPYQHLGMTVLRAVENRTWLVRSANTGFSAVVDPTGRVVKQTVLFEKAVITADVGLRSGPLTFYTRFTDIFAYVCMALTAAFVFALLRGRKRKKSAA
ncbi:MAG: apolipoprotein N-acyltransferase [Deltaproteobacteria bacterium RIFCSPLOWO2_02_FULL_53_8]|nr:MAG: apolipoprotein N-acyltransferase [Deltaproteobacteria bacterium RIFCSPLOWO2_02_FULL_53_8]